MNILYYFVQHQLLVRLNLPNLWANECRIDAQVFSIVIQSNPGQSHVGFNIRLSIPVIQLIMTFWQLLSLSEVCSREKISLMKYFFWRKEEWGIEIDEFPHFLVNVWKRPMATGQLHPCYHLSPNQNVQIGNNTVISCLLNVHGSSVESCQAINLLFQMGPQTWVMLLGLLNGCKSTWQNSTHPVFQSD